jgi:superfamily II DNA/RNA helicase
MNTLRLARPVALLKHAHRALSSTHKLQILQVATLQQNPSSTLAKRKQDDTMQADSAHKRRRPSKPKPAGARSLHTQNGSTAPKVSLPRSTIDVAMADTVDTGPAPDSSVLNKHLSTTTFASFNLNPALTIPFECCTDVQAKTLPIILQGSSRYELKGPNVIRCAGHDVLAQAKTGTGKTMSFMIPALQQLLKAQTHPQKQIFALILSPTRELATQIATAGQELLRNLPDIAIQVVTGGTNINSERTKLKSQPCHILVATPGRLLDHLGNGNLGERMNMLRMLVLDEADRLLDAGFKQDLEKIFQFLPDRSKVKRQSLLFSATIDESVKQVRRPSAVQSAKVNIP